MKPALEVLTIEAGGEATMEIGAIAGIVAGDVGSLEHAEGEAVVAADTVGDAG